MTVFQGVGADQEYCGRIFSQPICVIMASNEVLVAYVSYSFRRNYGPKCTVKAAKLCFFEVRFVRFLRVSANSIRLCDIRCQ